MVDFGTWLRRARRAQEMTAVDLADASGVSLQSIHSWEQVDGEGRALRTPSADSLERVERALGLSRGDYPFDGAGLADELEAATGGEGRVVLYCRETATSPCYVGFSAGGADHGTVSGEGVHGVEADAAFAARLLRSSDV